MSWNPSEANVNQKLVYHLTRSFYDNRYEASIEERMKEVAYAAEQFFSGRIKEEITDLQIHQAAFALWETMEFSTAWNDLAEHQQNNFLHKARRILEAANKVA